MPLTGWGFLHPWILRDPVTQGVEADVVSSSLVVLHVLEHLGVGLPVSVVGMGAEPVPMVCSEHWFRVEGTNLEVSLTDAFSCIFCA